MVAAHFANRSAKAADFAVTCDIGRQVAHTFGAGVRFRADIHTSATETTVNQPSTHRQPTGNQPATNRQSNDCRVL